MRGPYLSIPFVGGTLELMRNPYAFWEKQRAWASGGCGISWNMIAGKFTLLCACAQYAKIPFIKNGPTGFRITVGPNGRAVFGEHSILFMTGSKHKAMRSSFINLFGRKALGVYISLQDKKVREHVRKWLGEKKECVDMRFRLRDLNLDSSITVFVGPYVDDAEHIADMMRIMGEAFVSLPINFPGTCVWRTVRTRKKLERILTDAVRRSKKSMIAKNPPQCLLDFWSQRILSEINKADEDGEPHPEYADDFIMASTLMSILFAAQDASTSSLAQTFALMSDYPDVLEKVRKEQENVNPNGELLNYELIQKMTYTRQVIREILRFRPPVPMLAHETQRDICFDEKCTAPKGSIVFSSITDACQDGFTDPDTFDPDRMSPERREDVKNKSSYLVFGAGPHMCAGREYAMQQMIVFLSLLSTMCVWTRQRTSKSDEPDFRPSAYPGDLLITLQPKKKSMKLWTDAPSYV